jgi:hypothetical protein
MTMMMTWTEHSTRRRMTAATTSKEWAALARLPGRAAAEEGVVARALARLLQQLLPRLQLRQLALPTAANEASLWSAA